MKTELLWHGIEDIITGRIAPEAIIDMAPYIRSYMPQAAFVSRHVDLIGYGYVYISGQISGIDYATAYTLFAMRERKLASLGYKSINPMKLLTEQLDWIVCMVIDVMQMIKFCDKISMLENWEYSSGAQIEYRLAQLLCFEIVQVKPSLNYAL